MNLVPAVLCFVCLVIFATGVFAEIPVELSALDYSKYAPEVSRILKSADEDIVAGSFDEALTKLKKAVSLEQNLDNKDALLVREAKLNLFKGRVGYARFRLNRLCKQRYYSPAYIAAAQSYMYFEPYDRGEAKKRIDTILRKDPNNVEALIEAGFIQLYLIQGDKAIELFKQALKVKNDAIRAFYGIADVYVKTGRHDKAIKTLQNSLRVKPENGEAMLRIGDTYLGSVLKDRYSSAIQWYQRALAYANGQPRYYGRMMMAFFIKNNRDTASVYYKHLIKIAPSSSYIKWADGIFAEFEGKISTAKDKYEEAVALDRQNWLAQFCRANVYAGRGNVEFVLAANSAGYKYEKHKNIPKGIEAYKTIINNAPTFPYYKTVVLWYQKLIDTPSVTFWTDSANEEKLQKMKRFGEALKLGAW
jgi:tetratricopeptide (TPR) repeat protein